MSIASSISKTYLIHDEVPLNSRKKRKIHCTPAWPCKRLGQCAVCCWRRRRHFLIRGEQFIQRHRLSAFVTVSWPLGSEKDPWHKLWRSLGRLELGRSVRLGKYIRVLGIGDRETPHIHFILSYEGAGRLRRRAHRVGPKKTVVQIKPISAPRDLLAYLYDRNFLVVFQRPDRPKRIRIISGSRGMPCGFPTSRTETIQGNGLVEGLFQ